VFNEPRCENPHRPPGKTSSQKTGTCGDAQVGCSVAVRRRYTGGAQLRMGAYLFYFTARIARGRCIADIVGHGGRTRPQRARQWTATTMNQTFLCHRFSLVSFLGRRKMEVHDGDQSSPPGKPLFLAAGCETAPMAPQFDHRYSRNGLMSTLWLEKNYGKNPTRVAKKGANRMVLPLMSRPGQDDAIGRAAIALRGNCKFVLVF